MRYDFLVANGDMALLGTRSFQMFACDSLWNYKYILPFVLLKAITRDTVD